MSRVRRLPVVDEYVEGGRAAVYATSGEVVALSELATWVWTALTDEWGSIEDLADGLVREFGAPDDVDPVPATRATVEALVDHGLAELDPTAG